MNPDDRFLNGKTDALPYFVEYEITAVVSAKPVQYEKRVDVADEKAAVKAIKNEFPTADKVYARRGVLVVYWHPKGTKVKWIHCDQTDLLAHTQGFRPFQEEVAWLREKISYTTKAPHYIMMLPRGLEAYHAKQTPEFTCRVYNSSLAVPEEI